MTPQQWERVRELFHDALDLSPDERPSFLASCCPDAELRAELDKLLADAENNQTLDGPPADFAREAVRRVSVVHREMLADRLTGSTVSDRYRIEKCLGKGGHAVVFLATDTRIGNRKVVVKVLDSGGDARLWLEKKFRQEIEVLAKINHSGVVGISDCGELPGGHPFLVMDFIDGITLRRRMDTPVCHAEIADIMRQIGSALHAAHQLGVVHRDLKPENVMLATGTGSGPATVKLIDFGIARVRDGAAPGDETTHVIAGTASYMAPEQFRGVSSAATDVYALGLVCFELLTGVLPREAKTFANIPDAIKIPLKSALETEPEKRPGDAEAFAQSLAAGLSGVPQPDSRRGRSGPHRAAIAVAAVALVCAAAFVVWQHAHAKPLLTDKDVLVMADFTNSTSDPVFDGALRAGLAVALEQSPFLSIMSDDEMGQGLRLMGRSLNERITNEIAREICQRANDKATIGGSIAGLGRSYAVTLQATNCGSGETLAREQVEAEDKEHVLRAVSAAATAIRGKLGESLSSIRKLDQPLAQVTTSSLEALQAYALGYSERKNGGLTAIPFFRRATELDPNFAMAWHTLGTIYNNHADHDRAIQCFRRAYALIGGVTEREKLEIGGTYFDQVTGERDKAIDDFQLYLRTYPREGFTHNDLGNLYNQGGEFEKALAEFGEAARLAGGYNNLVGDYVTLGRFDEANAAIERAFQLKKSNPTLHRYLLDIALIQGDRTLERKEMKWFAGNPEEYKAFLRQAVNAAAHGRWRDFRQFGRQAIETANRANLAGTALSFQASEATVEALMGNCGPARSEARASIMPSQVPKDVFPVAFAMAFCGDVSQAAKIAGETSKRYPVHTIWNAVYLPTIDAAIELKRNQPGKAIELLQSAAPYERAYPEAICLRGISYLRLRKGAEAAIEFQKIVDHKGAYWGGIYSASSIGLARAATLSGDAAKAKRAYADFFALWKDAEPDVPLLISARKEYKLLR